MTFQSRPSSAIEAVIEAARDNQNHVMPARSGPSTTYAAVSSLKHVQSDATTLLSRLLSACPATTKPCIQFVGCGSEISASAVTLAILQVAAAALGPSLLLNACIGVSPEIDESLPPDPVSDAFIAGLYHRRLVQDSAGFDLLFGRGRRSTLTQIIAPFHFIAVDSPAPHLGPATTALAPMCSGTVLVVRAGASRLAEIKEAALHITRAGGRVLGSVLDYAPVARSRWLERAKHAQGFGRV